MTDKVGDLLCFFKRNVSIRSDIDEDFLCSVNLTVFKERIEDGTLNSLIDSIFAFAFSNTEN